MKLFDDKHRKELEASDRNRNIYDYINESSRYEIEKLRNSIEKLFSIYPMEEKFEMKEKIKTTEQFESTLFEMYLYSLFSKMNFKIRTHPKLKDTRKTPDFLISSNSMEAYVEAKIDCNSSNLDIGIERKRNQVINDINKIESGNYRIFVHKLDILCDNQPSTIKFRKHLKNRFKELNYEEVKETTLNGSIPLERYPTDNEDLDLKVAYKIIAVPTSYKDNRTIQMGPPQGAWSTSHLSIKKSLDKKRGRYGEMESPFIIAINSLDSMLDEEDVIRAVLGDSKDNGFFSRNNTKQNNNVSAVLIYKLRLENIDNPKYWFIHNVNALYPLNLNDLSLDSYYFKNGELAKHTN